MQYENPLPPIGPGNPEASPPPPAEPGVGVPAPPSRAALADTGFEVTPGAVAGALLLVGGLTALWTQKRATRKAHARRKAVAR